MPSLARFNEARLKTDGRYNDWLTWLNVLPPTQPEWRVVDGVVHVGQPIEDPEHLKEILEAFIPWRKGPWCVAGAPIDSEWRSNWKWDRIHHRIDLVDRRVLDVGAGNGYFGWRMLEAGAKSVVACDPTALFVMQHQLLARFAGDERHAMWACRLEELPLTLDPFDVVFSMGVLSHRRYREGHHMAHLGLLYRKLLPGGELVLETLVVPPEATEQQANGDCVLLPTSRYARMKNVYALPAVDTLIRWLSLAGFSEIECVDVTSTSQDEQRATELMPYQSLVDGLSREDPTRTIEGHPSPMRAMMVAKRPPG